MSNGPARISRSTEARLRQWYDAEVSRLEVESDLSHYREVLLLRRRRSALRGALTAITATGLAAVVIVVVIARIGIPSLTVVTGSSPGAPVGTPASGVAATSAPSPVLTLPPSAVVSAGASPSGAGPSTTSPPSTPSAFYADGIPSEIDGARVYRASDLSSAIPAGEFFLGGWDAGPQMSTCFLQPSGASTSACPTFEGLAEARGGTSIVTLRWRATSPHDQALVLLVRAEPTPTCVSDPPGACPSPTVNVLGVRWTGNP